MEKRIKIGDEITWDKVFEQATEDVSTYLWALESWVDPPEGYTQGYLLIMGLSHRIRGRSALALMDVELPSTFANYKDRLIKLWSKAESIFKEKILNNLIQLDSILRGEMIQRLNDLENCLKEVQHLAQDGDLLEDTEWVAEDVQEVAKDFLVRFQDLALMKEELKHLAIENTEGYRAFQDKFGKIEDLFKKCFGYFHTIKDMFVNLRTREYGVDFWWFTRIPIPEDIEEEKIPDAVMGKLIHAFHRSDAECPDAKEIIVYALGELDPRESQKIKHHILKCRVCSQLIADVHLAEGRDEVLKPRPEPPQDPFLKFSPTLKELVEKSFLINLSLFKLSDVKRGEIGLTRDRSPKLKEFKVEEEGILKSGDYFKIRFSIDRDAYIYILFQSSSGEVTELFSDKISGGRDYTLPEGKGFQLDEKVGEEIVCLLASEEQIEEIDKKILELEKIGIEKIGKVFPKSSCRLFKFRHE